MSETTPEATPAQESDDTTTQGTESDEGAVTDWQAEATRLREELTKARKWEGQAKKVQAKVQEYEREKLPEAERAAVEAEERGRMAATSEFGRDLARERFDALAGRRNPDFDTAQALEYVDLAKFLGEDGRPDSKAITAAVERLVPTASNTPPAFDGGTRTAPPAQQGMTGLIRKAAGRA